MTKTKAIAHRLLQVIPVLIGVTIVTFFLVHLTPGDPVRLMLGSRASDAAVAAIRHQYGLDKPLIQQYFIYMGNLLQGDLGASILYKKPVTELLLNFMPKTLFLIAYMLCLSLPATFFLSIVSARREGKLTDYTIRFLSVSGMSIPVFLLAVLLMRVFSVNLGWFPVAGFGETFLGHIQHMFLPALSISVWLVPLLSRNLRSTILERMRADYVTASHSKGLPEHYIFRRHVLKNSLLPTLNLLGVMIAYLIAGSVVVEAIFSISGLGWLILNAILSRDYFVVQGVALAYALFMILVTLCVDVASTLVDPRVSL